MQDRILELLLNTNAVESLTLTRVALTLSVASLCGIIIYLVYRFFNKSIVYNPNFNLLIVMVCVVTAFIIITIGANLVLTLGMVGALSVVRFRAAVKDPLDVGFLFWGVAAGLTSGARLYLIALIGTAFIALLYIMFSPLRLQKRSFLLILRYAHEAESAVGQLLKGIRYKLKNKTHTQGYIELTAEVKVARNDTSFMEPLTGSPDITSAVLVEYTGDYT